MKYKVGDLLVNDLNLMTYKVSKCLGAGRYKLQYQNYGTWKESQFVWNLPSNSFIEIEIQKTYQQRLLEETRELASKLNELNVFMSEDLFPKLSREKKDLMYEQQRAMSTYLQILGKRLELEGTTFTHNDN